ncbi:MAG: phosphate signaling complex protein PhoU [Treponema sp.]|jgi:phosphate transport system protein|nr:phosphate signaling complex protein PhoU [Treponema sp.]
MGTGTYLIEELQKLRHDILTMATRVEENLGNALVALKTGNKELVKKVREDDLIVDALQLKIEDDAAYVIATQHPVAGDLRELVAIFKLTGNIERVGDHAVHLAKAAKKLAKKTESPIRAQESLEKMAETGKVMFRAAINAFISQDTKAAREAAAIDNIIDEEHGALTEDILKLMKKNPDLVKSAMQILHTSNQLERLGDHITNICEAIIYMIEGKREELND